MSWSSSSCPSRSVSPVAPTIATPCPVPGRVHPSTASNARPSAVAVRSRSGRRLPERAHAGADGGRGDALEGTLVACRRLGPGLHLLEVRQHGGGEEARALRVPVSVGLGPRLRVVAQRVGDVELLAGARAGDVEQPALLFDPVSYTHLRAHETRHDLVCRLLLEKKK